MIVTLKDNARFVATFFTYENIEYLRQKNKKTGECLNGKFFWASDMVIVDKIKRNEIEEVINHLVSENEFEQIFKRIIED